MNVQLDVNQQTLDNMQTSAGRFADALDREYSYTSPDVTTGEFRNEFYGGVSTSLEEIAYANEWDRLPGATAGAMGDLWEDPWSRYALLGAGATLVPGVAALGYAAPAMTLGAMQMLPPSLQTAAALGIPYAVPAAADFVTGYAVEGPPPLSVPGYVGSLIDAEEKVRNSMALFHDDEEESQ